MSLFISKPLNILAAFIHFLEGHCTLNLQVLTTFLIKQLLTHDNIYGHLFLLRLESHLKMKILVDFTLTSL